MSRVKREINEVIMEWKGIKMRRMGRRRGKVKGWSVMEVERMEF